jgi:EmrB/QacA subfamily drug resistance transporter
MAVTQLKKRRDGRRWAALTLLCVASFMMILDGQIVFLALPAIQGGLDLPTEQAQWILTANAIAFGGLLLLGGRAADLLGRRRVFMVGVAGFLLTSLLSGIAWDGGVLVVARALHGFSSAVMVPSALSILMNTFPEGRDRNRAVATWSAVGGVGAVAGLLVGGGLTTALGWQWVFVVNVPVVLVVLVLAPFVLRESFDQTRRSFDIAGAVTSTGALTALIYAFVDAPAAGWTSFQTIGLLAAAILLTVLFLVIEARSAAPLVPLWVLRKRTVASGNSLMLMVSMFAAGESMLISLHLQQVIGYSAMQAGLAGSVMPVMAVVGAYVGQAVATRWGYRAAVIPAALAFGSACVFLARIPVQGRFVTDVLGPLMLFGLALGMAHTTSSIVALSGVAEAESGLASGLSSAGFQIGGAFGIVLVTVVSVTVTAGSTTAAGLASGYHAGFLALAILAAVLLVATGLLPARVKRTGARPAVHAPVEGIDRAA